MKDEKLIITLICVACILLLIVTISLGSKLTVLKEDISILKGEVELMKDITLTIKTTCETNLEPIDGYMLSLQNKEINYSRE